MKHTMENDKELFKLFADYEPQLSSDTDFINRLERNLHAIELVKTETQTNRRINRIAITAAFICGVICGIVSVLCYPTLSNIMHGFFRSFSHFKHASVYIEYQPLFSCIILSLLSLTVTYVAYDLTFSLTRRRFR